jgi:hypothetical protein
VKRVRVVTSTRFAFGSALWGGQLFAIPVLPGATVWADRIQCCPDGGPVAFYVSSPAYVQEADGSLVTFEIGGDDRLVEQLIEGEGCAAAWAAWTEGHGVTDMRP